MSEKIAEGFGNNGELCEYHYSFVQDGKLTLVGRKYVAQPNHNWGHRVAFAGTYVLTFDKESNKWERHDFPELVSEENSEEVLFVRDNQLYLLAFVNFGAIGFQKLFRWDSNSFNEVLLNAPETKTLTETQRFEVIAAAGTSSNGETILLLKDDNCHIQIYSLTVNGASSTVENISQIHSDDNHLRGSPVIAETVNDKVLISYAVHGCGFNWEKTRFFVFDLKSKTARHVDIEGEYSSLPQYGFVGPNCSFVDKKTNSFIVAGGRVQKGMTGSAFYGAVWALKGNIFDDKSTLEWVQLPQTVEEGEHIFDGSTLYTVNKAAVSKVQLDSI
ncbi:Fucose-specific lectin [Caenorhabditis elegans]|uniref:Fucose-specific lectin n=1 Tax=Caenorhabditis elegans TaxID=6239 RepID=Q20675_CAEEL|nr:Fucose-specific lectin [Caenorhabditis elegans]CCD66480.2 Fucose-specific lectin [Caenorhabditis elegans]|eukprot:NP_508527.2 Uncharacterized protein CELE_F52E4.5 [Caenorhabditis elegans]